MWALHSVLPYRVRKPTESIRASCSPLALPLNTLAYLYALIIGALWFDFAKVRKVRREYQMEMLKKHPKEAKKHPTTAAKNKIDAAKEAEREAAKAEKKRFGHSFIRKAKPEETAEGEKKSE